MWDVVSQVGRAAYRTAAKTGLAAGTEQPAYPCALPLQRLEDADDTPRVQELLANIFAAAKDLLENDAEHRWQLVDYQDPDKGGDLHLFTRPHIGPFNFAKATLSFMGVTPQQVLDTMHGDDSESRKKYSANLSTFEILARPTPTSNIQYHEYWAPPPVAGREFVFLAEKKYVEEDDVYYVYGCSIDYAPREKKSKTHVRASCLWGWELTPIGNNTMATYVSCMNPRGWTPTFIIGWLRSEIGKELVSCRRVLYGEAVNLERNVPERNEMDEAEISAALEGEENEQSMEMNSISENIHCH
ncbi:START domain [Trypanosoma melophagium]|uniref:START domain n=1 Tax=Trypanosoma melophagium TaxID=715481 RepID=UPI003519F16C|nr:START domain [Trypanosoma melophagium]